MTTQKNTEWITNEVQVDRYGSPFVVQKMHSCPVGTSQPLKGYKTNAAWITKILGVSTHTLHSK